MLHLAGTEYTLKDKSFDIFISGCTRKCRGCYNKEMWDFNYGVPISSRVMFMLANKMRDNLDMIETIRIMGGDLLCNDEQSAQQFIKRLRELLSDVELNWVLFTGAEENELPEWCKEYFDVIKVGRYEQTKYDKDYIFASTNQRYLRKGEDY